VAAAFLTLASLACSATACLACSAFACLALSCLADPGAVSAGLDSDPAPCSRDERSRRGLGVPVAAPSVGGVLVGVGAAGVAGVVVEVAAGVVGVG
jgi:hypothetical protein